MWWIPLACASPPPPAPEPAPVPIVGTWTGAPCGARTWTRTFTFAADGTYHGRDPISPCPKNARCVWSGVVDFDGRWTLEGPRLTLAEAPAPMTDQWKRPEALVVMGDALAEPDGCTYRKEP